MRQHIWSAFIASCAILTSGIVAAPDRARIGTNHLRRRHASQDARTSAASLFALVFVGWIVLAANTAQAQIVFTLSGTKGSGVTTVTISGSTTPTGDLQNPDQDLRQFCATLRSGNQFSDGCGNNIGEYISLKSPGPNVRALSGTWPSSGAARSLTDPGGNVEYTSYFPIRRHVGAPTTCWDSDDTVVLDEDPSATGTALDDDGNNNDDFYFTVTNPDPTRDGLDVVVGDTIYCSGSFETDLDPSEISAPEGTVFYMSNGAGMQFEIRIGTITDGSPGFTKSFAKTEIEPGETTTLTLTIDNSANKVTIQNVAFTDPFPDGMVVADIPNVTISNEVVQKEFYNRTRSAEKCSGTITAVAGSNSVSFSDGVVEFGEVCTITVDVTTTIEEGTLENVTEELTSCISPHGGASATLRVGIDDGTKERTERIISNFMVRRAAQIVSKEPDLTKRLADGGQSSRAAAVPAPVNVTGGGTVNNYNLAFATSLRQVIGSAQAARRKNLGDASTRMALGAKLGARSSSGHSSSLRGGSLKDKPESSPDGEPAAAREFANRPQTGFGFWTEGTLSKVRDGTAKGDFDLLYVGADYRFNPDFVVGILGQFDRTDEVDATNDFSISGKGWLAGPYVVARLSANLIFDARAAWGKSDNEVSPYNTYTDEFKGQRSLVRSRLTGDFQFGRLHVAPHVGVVYYQEEQKAYVDSLGNTISSQKVELGRLTFGPKLSTTFMRPDGASISPHIALHGIWDFRRTDLVNINTGVALTGTDDFRARAQAGVTARRADGMEITAEGFYDGIGANGFNAYGGTLRFYVPF